MKKQNETSAASELLPKKRPSLGELWKNKRTRAMILAFVAVFLAGAVYLALSLTVLRPDKEEEYPTVGNHGETMVNGKPFVIEPLESDKITGIRVENGEGGFYYYKAEDGVYYFEGAEGILYDETSDWQNLDVSKLSDAMEGVSMVDALFGTARYLLAASEVVGFDSSRPELYGLGEKTSARMTVTYLDEDGAEKSETVLFGSLTVSGGSYYVMKEGRDALYVVTDSFISRCIMANVKAYFVPRVAPTISSSAYSAVDRFTLKKNENLFIDIRKLSDEEKTESGDLFSHILVFPESYYPSDTNFNEILAFLANFTGSEVVEYDVAKLFSDPAELDAAAELFRRYSLHDENGKWANTLYYRYDEQGFDITLYISEKLQVVREDGKEEYVYYVYSPDFDVIAEFSADTLSFIEWDLLKYMDNHSFATSIDNCRSMEFRYGSTVAKFNLDGSGSDLTVTSPQVKSIDVNNFRQLYKAFLFTTLDGYAEKPQEGTPLLSIVVTLRNGATYDYVFYGMTARKAYYTLNGAGEFYINRDYVRQLISSTDGILAGKEISVERKK